MVIARMKHSLSLHPAHPHFIVSILATPMTLIETIIYIALLGMLMIFQIMSAFSFSNDSERLQAAVFKAEDAFLFHYNDYK